MPDIDERLATLEIIIGIKVSSAAAKTVIDLNTAIQTLKATGMSDKGIKNILQRDLKEGGVIFGTYKNAIKNTTGSAVQMASTEATRSIFEERGVKEYKWITAGGNVCPDCLPRHNEVATYEEWEIAGLPRSGFSVCGANCGCTIVPSNYRGENLESALYRTERVKQLRKKYKNT